MRVSHKTRQNGHGLLEALIVPVHFEGWKHLKESKEDLTQAFAKAGRDDHLLWLEAGKPTSVVVH
jgi:hypothetical protein